MFNRIKSATSLVVLALLGLSMTCDARAGSSRDQARTDRYVQPCVSEIGRHADYEGATRITHVVDRLLQRNPVELEIRVETRVASDDPDGEIRRYRASCVVAGVGKLVRFNIDRIG